MMMVMNNDNDDDDDYEDDSDNDDMMMIMMTMGLKQMSVAAFFFMNFSNLTSLDKSGMLCNKTY